MTKRFLYYSLALVLPLFLLLLALLPLYFPGQQFGIALTLGTGLGAAKLQQRIDACEEKAIQKATFTAQDTRFLQDLYTCLYKGARLTQVLPEVSKMMEHYLSKSGQSLRVSDRIFTRNRTVEEVKQKLLEQIFSSETLSTSYTSEEFHMADPANLDSVFGLYYGHLIAVPIREKDGFTITWRAEVPWTWPSYDHLTVKYGFPHAESFPIPNISGRLVLIDNGLGEYLTHLGLAKSFVVYAEWTEKVSTTTRNASQAK